MQQVVACRGRLRTGAWLLQEVVSEGHLSQQTKCNCCQESCELTTLTAGACPQEMMGTVQRIMDNGHAYSADGDVYFDVGSLPGYGRLSGRAQVGCPRVCWHCGIIGARHAESHPLACMSCDAAAVQQPAAL